MNPETFFSLAIDWRGPLSHSQSYFAGSGAEGILGGSAGGEEHC
jgi:hypothetical protein